MARASPKSQPRTYSIAEARQNLPRLVHQAEKGTAIELTRRGKPVAVVVSLSDYQRLSTPSQDFWASLQEWRRKYRIAEEGLDPDEIFKDVRDRSPGRDFSW